MQFLTEWINNIILLILLASVLELLLPNSSLQRYVKMVVGLLLLVIILTPLLSILTKDVDGWVSAIGSSNQLIEEKDVQFSLENKKKEIQQVSLAYISEQVAVQLKRQVEEEMITKFEKEVVAVNVALKDFLEEEDYLNSVTQVSIHLRSINGTEEVINETIPAVALVNIDTTKQVEVLNEEKTNETEILQYLATTWPIPIEKIEVLMEGGSLDQ